MGKARVIISSDIGGSDPDDMESMAHALLYADKFDIQGLISTPTKNDGRAADIKVALDAYSKDYNNLKTWGDYPTPDYLKSVVYQGNLNVPGSSGYSTSTAGSKAIVDAAHAASPTDPLYVLCWGAMTDVAQALHDDPSIATNLRILSSNGWNGTQDPYSRDYIYNNFKDVWWIESKSTHRGIYVNDSGVEGNLFNMNEAKGHGALGDYFYNARPWGVKMGDSWSIAYLIDQIDNNAPGGDSWGGTFVKTGHGPNFWTDDSNPLYKLGTYNGAAYVREHQQQIYNDFYKQLDKAKTANPNATNVDDPVVAKADAASTDKDKAAIVKVLAKDTALDGGLKVASADAASANGGSIVINTDGTVTYTPKTGYVGTDSFNYVAKDADGDQGSATVSVTVKDIAATAVPDAGTAAGTGNSVLAADDKYTMDAGKKLYFNTSHLLLNDKGLDGGLKIAISATTSVNGITLEKWADGTVVYKAGVVNGTDRIDYLLTDKDGSSDTGSVIITIKNGQIASTTTGSTTTSADSSTQSSSTVTTIPVPSTSELDPNSAPVGAVVAGDDKYTMNDGISLYFNTRYVTMNDKGNGALTVVAVDATSERGVNVTWKADGTTIYKAPVGFEGIDKIYYKVFDEHGGHDIGTVLVTIV